MPVEIPKPIAFDRDIQHASYDRDYVTGCGILLLVGAIFREFRSRFIGKNARCISSGEVFDLAVTRFSGRRAPEREGADRVTREAYSHEVISAGFGPGGGNIKGAAFYAYAAPEPAGYGQSPVRPSKAFYHPQIREFILMYDDLGSDSSPRLTLLEFLQSTYEAERQPGVVGPDGVGKNGLAVIP